ncbi:MAG: type I restriction endonuclease [bacterium]|nr:type I restriction endonuclease [bacterium]
MASATTTEEAAKNAFVMPFIAALGYDVFNPTEVVPEFVADIGTKQGEKVDYAILRDGQPIILIECKRSESELNKEHASQLYRYFSTVDAKLAILTNGIVYKFYSDLEEPNKMDNKPFLEFSLRDLSESLPKELERFQKEQFNIEEILSSAVELKYTKEIKSLLARQMTDPDEGFIRFFVSNVHHRKMTAAVKEQFSRITRKALSQFIDDRLDAMIKKIRGEAQADVEATENATKEEESQPGKSIETTEDELECHRIVRAILRQTVPSARIVWRDAKSYFSVLLDDNNRKPICCLASNSKGLSLGLLGATREWNWVKIETLDEVYKFADQFIETVRFYESGHEASSEKATE